ncbi:hypothetical protein Mal52_10570 [Symmachiella dynata]|uniref:Uncharacterized protein n=1 Tax=Symmachiella dynata TaxID=2527995 RepID=A0A517ZJE1_9PLAN|nr:hypothetical protein [Symmachiella dynata]QDU42594.1 hypothetical protein Mal52_10570 [Symmachiella dynata]
MRFVFVGLLLIICQTCWADDAPPQAIAKRDPLSFTPQRVETPALQYALMPPYLDQTEGNAATMYYRALLFLSEANRLNQDPNLWTNIRNWASEPLDTFPVDKARETLKTFQAVLDSIEIAARRTDCHWDLPQAEYKENVYYLRLPEIQEMRDIARLLVLKSRLEIATSDYEQAVRTFQTTYAMARHVSQPPIIICDLIGVAIVSMINDQVAAFVRAPDAPNLYWPLTALPRPIIDVRPSMGLEGNGLYFVFPQLLAAKTKTLTPEQWQAELEAFLKKFEKVAADTGGMDADELADIKKKTDQETVLARAVEAKTGLIKMGHPPEEAKAMATGQAILLYTALVFDHFRDDLFKWAYVPLAEAGEEFRNARNSIEENSDTVEIVPIAALLLPALDGAARAIGRQDARIAHLRAFEAIRMYTAKNDGVLPDKLSEIKAVPIPNDPLTGKPFFYHLDGETGALGTMPLRIAQ